MFSESNSETERILSLTIDVFSCAHYQSRAVKRNFVQEKMPKNRDTVLHIRNERGYQTEMADMRAVPINDGLYTDIRKCKFIIQKTFKMYYSWQVYQII